MRYQFGEFILDLHTGELLRGEVATPLRRQTLRLLQALLDAAPALLTHDQLLDEVWGRTALSPTALPQAISELRRALGDDAESPRYIDTRRGLGYRFMAPVLRLDVSPPAPSPPPSPASATGPTEHVAASSRSRSRLRFSAARLGILFALLGLGTLAAVRIDHSRPVTEPQAGSPQQSAAQAVANEPSQTRVGLAIAPFAAGSNVAAWVPHAATELFAQALHSERLSLYRSDALGHGGHEDSGRWQHQAHDLLGASHALSGRWQLGAAGELQLDLSVLDLGSGEMIARRQFARDIAELDQLVMQASDWVGATLRLAQQDPAGVETAGLASTDRSAYWSALSALAQGDALQAASLLAELHQRLDRPAWIEPDLTRALVQSKQSAAAQALLQSRLQQGRRLPLGERLRLQAQLAELRHQPLQVAAANRALVELYPDNLEHWIDLVDAELDALQGALARHTMAQLATTAQAHADPRLSLLRARLALIDSDYPQAQLLAATAMQQAVAYRLPTIAIGAGLAQADSLSLQGQVADAADGLLQVERDWADHAGAKDRFELRMRRIMLLRVSGALGALPELLQQAHEQATSPAQQTQWGIEQALLQAAQGQHDAAEDTLGALSTIVAEVDQPELRIRWHDARAVVALGRNQVDLARQQFDQAFAIARRMGHERFSAPLQVNAGMLLARQRRYAEADALWSSALEVFSKLGDRRGQATCLGNLAASAAIQGRTEQSRELNTQALALFRELDLTDALARTAYNLGLQAARFGRRAEAVELFSEARTAWLAGDQLDLAIRAAVGEAELTLLSARPAAALRALDSLPPSEHSSALSRAALLAMRAQIVLAQDDLMQSKALQEQALSLRKDAGSEAWIALSELDLLRLAWLRGEDVTQVYVQAEALARRFTELKETRDAARAWLLVAEAQLSAGRPLQAAQAIERVQRGLEAFADRPLELDLLRVSAWAAAPAERRVRLDQLRSRALEDGYLLTVALIDASRQLPFNPAGRDLSLRLSAPAYAQRD